MWFVYIILCADNSLYTGFSNHPEKRFRQHAEGKGAKYTKTHQPIKIIYEEQFTTKIEALKRESEIKSWPRSKKIKTLKLEL
ncbi:MAG TPA: GIY-YIG nuclease family protein [Patescibacteria group bacterium]